MPCFRHSFVLSLFVTANEYNSGTRTYSVFRYRSLEVSARRVSRVNQLLHNLSYNDLIDTERELVHEVYSIVCTCMYKYIIYFSD